jgi:hypothetical protein
MKFIYLLLMLFSLTLLNQRVCKDVLTGPEDFVNASRVVPRIWPRLIRWERLSLSSFLFGFHVPSSTSSDDISHAWGAEFQSPVAVPIFC